MVKLFALASLLTLVLTACGAPQAANRTANDGQPKRGGVITMRVENDPYDFDLSYAGKAAGSTDMFRAVTESLLGYKVGPDVGYSEKIFQPELAERWEVSQDARNFTFYLRKGAKFQDQPPVNGREFTADDVKWNF